MDRVLLPGDPWGDSEHRLDDGLPEIPTWGGVDYVKEVVKGELTP
jgi:hypothetical protein